MKGLMYDLKTLPEFDFTEEKWNQTVVELMSIGNGIWGMSPENEPRGGVFFNKRMLKEAGISDEEPYDLQRDGKWTWSKFEEYCKKLTVDADGDGKQISTHLPVSQNTTFLCVLQTTMQHSFPVTKTEATRMLQDPKNSSKL